MSNQLVQPSRDSYTSDEAYRDAMQAFGTLVGQSTWAAPLSLTGYDDDAGYAVTLFNGGASGKHLDITGILQVNNTGVHTSVFDAVTATIGTLNVTGNTTLGDEDTDTQVVIGITQWRNAASTQYPLRINTANNHVIVGAPATMGGITAPDLQVLGRLYVAPESANDHALQIRRSSAETNGWWVGLTTAGANSDLIFKDDGDTERFRVGDASSTYQGVVTGQFHATNGAVFDGGGLLVTAGGLTVTGPTTLNTGLTVTGSGAFSGGLSAGASSAFTGGVSVVTGVLSVLAGSAYIGDTSNANVTLGLTINQGAADDEILSLKSSDVAHGMLGVSETDTYGALRKNNVSLGGLAINGVGAAIAGLVLQAYTGLTDNTRSTAGGGAIVLNGLLKSGVGAGSLGADKNIVVVRDSGTARFILDSDGDSYQDAGRTLRAAGGAADDTGVGWTNYDTVDDIAALDALAVSLAREGDPLRERFLQGFGESRAFLESIPGKPIVSFNDGPGQDGHAFVNMSRLTMLLTGAVRQMGLEMRALRSEVRALRAGT